MTCYGNGQKLDGGSTSSCNAYNSTVYKVGTPVLSPAVKTQINFTNVEAGENPAGLFNLATDTITIPYDGTWTVTSTIEIITAATGFVFLTIAINTGGGYVDYSVSSVEPNTAAYCNLTCAITKLFTTGDLIRIFAQQNTGFNATINGVYRRCNCSIISNCLP